MQPQAPKIPKKYQPLGYQILHEDLDLIIGSKAPGFLTVAALWEKNKTIHGALNQYVQKGNARSTKCVYVVHRLDQATSGVLVFAKSEKVQQFLKNDWTNTRKTYYTIINGKLPKKSGLIESYLQEDDDYVVHSSQDSTQGKLAKTEYEVLKETDKFSLVKINLLTGKKNQIRVHMSEAGCPVVGDVKYGDKNTKSKDLMLHSFSIELTHPFKKERLLVQAPVPPYFKKFVDYNY
ncbi:RNA pseudouridine synthase [bacterium]|nr:RNA pseudouridine synthase [bacterium]